jgi:hypothetical protein
MVGSAAPRPTPFRLHRASCLLLFFTFAINVLSPRLPQAQRAVKQFSQKVVEAVRHVAWSRNRGSSGRWRPATEAPAEQKPLWKLLQLTAPLPSTATTLASPTADAADRKPCPQGRARKSWAESPGQSQRLPVGWHFGQIIAVVSAQSASDAKVSQPVSEPELNCPLPASGRGFYSDLEEISHYNGSTV